MAVRKILQYPDPRLRTVAASVDQVNEGIRLLIDDIAETMYAAPGVGLAATQIDVHKRVLVIDISEKRNELHVLINPELIKKSGEAITDEGCLSLPGIFEPVTRAESIRVRAQDRLGETLEFDTDGLLAVCIQHEMDHLEGKVFVDYLSRLKQQRIEKKLLKQQRLAM